MKKLFFYFILNLFICINIYGKDPEVLNLDVEDAVLIAVKNNLGIKIEENRLKEKKWIAATSWNTFIPSINLNTGISRVNDGVIEKMKYDLLESIKSSYGLSHKEALNSSIYKDGKESIVKGNIYTNFNTSFSFSADMIFNINSTVLSYRSNKITLLIAKETLKKNVKKAYYSLLLLNENIKIIKYNLDSAEKRYKLAQSKYDSGLISELEKLKAEYSYKDIELKLMKINHDYEDILLSFKQMLGVKKDIKFVFSNELKIPDFDEINEDDLISGLLTDNLQLKLLNCNLKELYNKRNIYISDLTPSFHLMYTFNLSYQKSNPFEADSNWYDNNNWKQNSGMLDLSLSFPIDSWHPFSKTQIGILKSNLQIKRQHLIIDEQLQKMEYDIKSLIRRIKKSTESIAVLQINLNIAEKILILNEASFEKGIISLLELEDSEKKLNSAKYELLKEKYEYISCLLEIYYILNLR